MTRARESLLADDDDDNEDDVSRAFIGCRYRFVANVGFLSLIYVRKKYKFDLRHNRQDF